jgi:hypothetical protein
MGFAASKFMKVKPAVFDPGDTDEVASAWVTRQGLPDAGKSDHALYLAKTTTTATNAAALAIVQGVQGTKLTEIGWDVRTDGHCGAGAPRFNVVTTDNVTHFIGCSSPPPISMTTINDRRGKTWERRRYDPMTAFPPILPADTVKSITVVFDEGTDQGEGFAYVDNIDINGTLIGRPGINKKK